MTRFPILHIFTYVLRPFAYQFTMELPKWPDFNYMKQFLSFVNRALGKSCGEFLAFYTEKKKIVFYICTILGT